MVVLDTHAWFWWVSGVRRLSDPAHAAIEGADAIGIASISCWELGMLAEKRRIDFEHGVSTWIRQALSLPGVTAIPLEPKTAVEAALLDREVLGDDPADRLIYATARSRGAPLVTRDRRLRDFDPRGTIW